MTDPVSLQEFHEIHDYIRHSLSVYVTWFTFFLAFFFGAMAWTLKASIDRQGYLTAPTPFFFVLALFSLQLLFGIWLTVTIRSEFAVLDERALSLLQNLSNNQEAPVYGPQSPIPISIHFAFQLMQWTLISQLLFWWLVAAFVYFRRGEKVLGSSLSDI